jgi:hypothetical protein
MNIRKQTIKLTAIPVALTALFLGTLAAHAGETVVGKVPFEFAIGDKTFPAGEYQFEVDHVSPGTVLVRNMDLSIATTALSLKADDDVVGDGPAVRFNVYGQQRFLSMIRTSQGTAVTLRPSREERMVAKVQGASTVATVRPTHS